MLLKVLVLNEFTATVRTSRIYIILLGFLFFGFLSPIITRFLPEIIAGLGANMQFVLPELTWIDSFEQLFKNYNQIMVLVLILTFMGAVAEEKNRGTAILVLTKPVHRGSFVIAKFIVAAIIVFIGVILSYLACLIYTRVLFFEAPVLSTLIAVFLFIVFALYMLGVTIGVSAVVKNQTTAGLVALGTFFITAILPSLHNVFFRYSPGALSRYQSLIVRGAVTFSETLPAALVTLVLAALFLFLGISIFNKQEI